jgi:glycosyltransferase involved in cell wall biosynthesis
LKRIAILTNIVPPYRLPLFNGISEKVCLDVLVCTDNEKNRKWSTNTKQRFKVKKLHGVSLTLRNSMNDYRFIYLKFSILIYLLFKRPDKVVIGDASLTSYLAAFFCKVLGIKYIWWNEVLPFTPIRYGFLGKLRNFSIRNASHHFVSGTLAKEFIQNYGINQESITIIPDAVDNARYFELHKKLAPSSQEIRRKYAINPDDFVMLYVGQFIERKNIQLMLDSYKKLLEQDERNKFILVGGGELKEKILQFKEEHMLDGLIVLDFMEAEKLAELYSISDVLILISKSEPWGMVVNESMCFGVPVVASKYVGAGADLINEDTGIVIDEVNLENLVHGVNKVKKTAKCKSKIINEISNWNNKVAVESFLRGLN